MLISLYCFWGILSAHSVCWKHKVTLSGVFLSFLRHFLLLLCTIYSICNNHCHKCTKWLLLIIKRGQLTIWDMLYRPCIIHHFCCYSIPFPVIVIVKKFNSSKTFSFLAVISTMIQLTDSDLFAYLCIMSCWLIIVFIYLI